MAQLKNTASEITSNIDNLRATTTDLEEQMHKQEKRHYQYVALSDSCITELKKQIDKTSESIQELKERIRKSDVCIKILCISLFLAGIGLLALTCHVLTM